MGCDHSTISKEKHAEYVIRSLERSINFAPNSCLVIDYSFRKYSHKTQINKNQWEDLVFTLNLKTKNREESPNIERFFESFKEGEFYLTKQLQLTGIMLSTAKPRQRAKVIFEMYDEYHTAMLSITQIREMFSDLIDISVYRIPLLMNEDSEEFNYIQRLRHIVDVDRQAIIDHFLVEVELDSFEHCSPAFFSAAFSVEEIGKLLTPHGMRMFIDSPKILNKK